MEEKLLEDKIRKWEEEIARSLERQKEMNAKYNENMRELRKKIETTRQQIREENNELIAEAVRTIYGEVTAENIESFKRSMQAVVDKADLSLELH